MDPSEEATDQNLVSTTENYFVMYTFTDRSHSSRVAQSIMKLCMEEQLFVDVTVLVEGKEFQLHRLVLSAQSCFFRSMFASNLKEGHNRVIELKDVSASIFQLLVDYIYHGTVKLRLEQLQETYEVADMYQLTSLFEECSRFLVRTVQVKNCLQIMWLADQHSDTSLYTAAKHCAKTQLSQLCDTEEFLNLPLRLLTDIITDGVPCSQNPTVAIKNWIHFNKEEREGFTEKLLSSLKSIDDEEEEEEEEEDEDDDQSVDDYEDYEDYELEYEYSELEYDFGHESEEEEEEEEDAAAAEARKAANARNANDPQFQELLQSLREGRGEENRCNPYCFQDDPQWGPGEERPRPTPDPEGRLQNTNWCQCGQCTIMSEVEECVCCHELPATERFFQTDPCVTQHEDFSRFVTSREILIPLLQFATKMTAAQFECKEHRHLRVAGYRKFTNLVYGFLGKARRVSVPTCVIKKIRQTYPEPDGHYTGFKYYSDYASGELPIELCF
ncbi:kelch repeat and BTB domain-containing protein 4 isoform X2 [Bufo bufo]|uniref:kelch repeat and BTB domain-containing protein 4 isoform X2 n=1 Tax=Bufo bufo TaxID=8384 RepID=UPI001ABE873C|nr:kelch repeat and BTB domain-containing protein 4 isoform X2 [Bufo bufo]